MARVAIGMFGMQHWFPGGSGGDLAPVVELMKLADAKGIDQVNITDHVIMGEELEAYPYGKYGTSSDYPWFEPMVTLAAIAAVTTRIRLATGVLISPLRPTPLLAKQLATLDQLSRGRVTIGFGTGWQKEEYQACGVPFEGRYGHMMEQVEVCRLLWRQAPASFHGRYHDFDRLYSRPAPVNGDIPIWFGLNATPRNVERMAAAGDGWIPIEQRPERLKEQVATIRRAIDAKGRDAARFDIRTVPRVVRGAAGADLDATLAGVPALIEAGATVIEFHPMSFLKGPDEFEAFLDRILEVKAA